MKKRITPTDHPDVGVGILDSVIPFDVGVVVFLIFERIGVVLAIIIRLFLGVGVKPDVLIIPNVVIVIGVLVLV